jgi:hypothetical protein
MKRLAPLLLLAACGGSHAAAPLGNSIEHGHGPAIPVEHTLQGPFASPEAYCASLAPMTCYDQPTPTADGDAAPFDDVRAFILSSADPDDSVHSCAVGIQRGDQWWMTAPSEDACYEPGYIDLEGVQVSREGDGVIAVSLAVHWETNTHDEASDTTETVLCGARGDAFGCTPMFVSACTDQGIGGDCIEHGYDLAWTVAGGVVTVKGDASRGDHVKAIVGPHRLF